MRNLSKLRLLNFNYKANLNQAVLRFEVFLINVGIDVTIGKRIRQSRDKLKLTQNALAKKLKGVSHVAISQWESNATKPNAENVYSLSQLFGCTIPWLLYGDETKNNATTVTTSGIKIPLIGYEQIREWDNGHFFDKEIDYIMSNLDVSNSTFAITLTGDDMSPTFIEGDVIIIDPEVAPIPGEFVLATQEDSIFFRKLKVDSEGQINHFSLLPLNPDYPIIKSKDSIINIIGTMVEHRIFRRKR